MLLGKEVEEAIKMGAVSGLVILFLCVSVVLSDNTLVQVNLVYRHGDRSPVVIYPTDPHQADAWPQGLGWLSKIGMREHYALGQWLRGRYMDTGFINKTYLRDEIKIESSDEDRCLMSAYSNLAGLYPPSEDDMFHPNLTWQPIPVHTRPTYEDRILNMGEHCPKYDQLLAQTLKSHAITDEEKENKAFYEWLGSKTHVAHENISNIWQVADTLLCEKMHNLSWPSWMNETVYQKLRTLDNFQFTLLFKGKDKGRLKGGPLLQRFIENMQKGSKSTKYGAKMYMYSAHDTTVAALLSAMELFDGISPQYTATVIAELHKTGTGYVVRLFYKNETNGDTAFPLTLPGCNTDCPLDQFIDLTKPVISDDWMKECGLVTTEDVKKSFAVASIIAIAEGCIILVLLVAVTIWCIKMRRRRSVPFQRFEG